MRHLPIAGLLLVLLVLGACTAGDVQSGDVQSGDVQSGDVQSSDDRGGAAPLGEDLRVVSLEVPPGGEGEVVVDIAPGDTSVLLIATGSGPEDQVYIDRVVGPDGLVDFEPDQPVNSAENAVLVPNRDDQPFDPGRWTFLVGADDGVTSVDAVIKSSDPFGEQVLDLALYVVAGSEGLDEQDERDELADLYAERGEEILSPHGLHVGDLELVDVGDDVIAEFANLELDGDEAPALRDLCATLTGLEGPTRRLVIGIVETYEGPDNEGTEGIAAGTPGSAVLPGPTGCVTLATDSGRDITELATSAWHEAGHSLGLLHTTEEEGEVFDLLGDTPECDAATYDLDDSGFVDEAECADADGRNFMFYDSDGTEMTDGQAFVLRNHPLLRPIGS